jgi:glutamine amidotransferase-like uncharacterized protein
VSRRRSTVLLYQGMFSAPFTLQFFLRAMDIPFTNVSDDDLADFPFSSHQRLFIFGAGHYFGSTPEKALGGSGGHANLRRAVADGMNYLGICAGAFAATRFAYYPIAVALRLTKARPRWPGETGAGTLLLTIRVAPRLARAAGLNRRVTRVWYHNGPIFSRTKPSSYDTLAAFEPTAEERREARQFVLYRKRLNGAAAIAESRYGKGRVVLCVPHFELGGLGIREYQRLLRDWLAREGCGAEDGDPLAFGEAGYERFMAALGGLEMQPVRSSVNWRLLAAIVRGLCE